MAAEDSYRQPSLLGIDYTAAERASIMNSLRGPTTHLNHKTFKSALFEFYQQHGVSAKALEFRVIDKGPVGRDPNKRFECSLTIPSIRHVNAQTVRGFGKSKKDAEHEGAKQALKLLANAGYIPTHGLFMAGHSTLHEETPQATTTQHSEKSYHSMPSRQGPYSTSATSSVPSSDFRTQSAVQRPQAQSSLLDFEDDDAHHPKSCDLTVPPFETPRTELNYIDSKADDDLAAELNKLSLKNQKTISQMQQRIRELETENAWFQQENQRLQEEQRATRDNVHEAMAILGKEVSSSDSAFDELQRTLRNNR